MSPRPSGPSPNLVWGCGILTARPLRDRCLRGSHLQQGGLRNLRRHLLRPGAARLRLVVCQASSWPQRGNGAAQPLTKQLKAVAQRLISAWQTNAKALQFGSGKTLLAMALLMAGTLTAAANIWGVKRINSRMLRQVGPQASELLGREVTVGQLNWLAPTGLTGLHPVASLGPVSVGPGAAEGSWAHLPEIRISVDLVKSLAQRKMVLKLHSPGAEVDLVQASNLSWFGYPEDTLPSARDFLPGLYQARETVHESGAQSTETQQEPVEDDAGQAAGWQQASRAAVQRHSVPAPPDAAINFAPAVGKDLIADSYAQRRSKTKPTFGPASHAAPLSALHSPPHQRSWLQQQGQQPSQGTPEQDADEERRQSGQGASTSRQGDSRGRPEVPSLSKGSSRGPSPTSPFGSITLGSGRHICASAKKPDDAFETATTHMHTVPDSKGATTQHTDQSLNRHFTEAPAQVSQAHRQTFRRQCDDSDRPCNHNCGSHAVVEAECTAATDAEALPEQALQVQSHQAQQSIPGPAGRYASSTPAAGTSQPVLDSSQGRRNTSNALPTSVLPNAVLLLSERPSLADSESTVPALSDDTLNRAAPNRDRRRKKSRKHCKPGPSAFPQLPYERSLQLQQSARALASQTPDSKHVPASDTARQTSARTDILADAMQRRLQLQERRADRVLGGGADEPQQRLSQHGGYLQRGVQERLPHRRTTRSMLRGADTQTGNPVDPGLAPYYASASVRERELHPAWSMYHQQRREKSAEAAAATAQEGSPAATERQQHDQQAVSTAAQSAANQEGVFAGSQQATGPLSKIQQGLTRTTQRVGKTLDQGRAAADRACASSAHFVKSAWSSSSEWNHNSTEPDWPEQPGQVNSAGSTASDAASEAISAEGTDSLTAEATTTSHPPSSAQEESAGAVSVDPAASLDDEPAHAEQLLSSFRLHSVTTPSILSTLNVPMTHNLGVLPQPAAIDFASARFAASGLTIPGAGTAFVADCISQFPGQYSPAEPSDGEHGSDWDTPDISRGAWGGHADPSVLGSQPGESIDKLSSVKQLSEGLPSDQLHPPGLSGRLGRGRMGAVSGREDTLVEPKYTPGVPPPPRGTLQISATADARLQRWIGQYGRAVLSKFQPPQVAIDSLAIRQSEINAWVAGETVPRHFEQVNALLRLGSNYQRLELNISALAHERDPAQDKCTMLSPNAARHLRGGSIGVQAPLDSPPGTTFSATSENAVPGYPQSPVGPLGLEEGAQHPDWGWRHHRRQRQRPTGGRLNIHVTSEGLTKENGVFPDLRVTLRSQELHAPLIERMVELPVDITAGRVNGELKLHCHDAATWRFPSFSGNVACRGLDFHFWDAVDDLSCTNMDLVFDRQRLYMHNASGMFGSVPLTLSGDVGINPDTGQYRLSGQVAGVEVNELRKTLGVRPTPYSVGGAVRGVLHVTGALDQPVFSGTAVAAAPSEDMLANTEECAAKATLTATSGSVAAYDKVPLAAASCLFTMDTATNIFLMHSFQAEPVGGGKMLGSGRMWVAPAALEDPRAVKISMQGQGLPTEALLKRYLPPGTALPKALTLGPGEVQGSMQGPHTNPTIQATWQVPVAEAWGQVKLDKDAMQLSAKAPAMDVSGVLHMRPPSADKIRAAVTQAEVTAVSVPVLEGAEVDASFKGLDVMPMISPTAAENRPSLGQPTRLRLTGRTKLSGRLSAQPHHSNSANQLPASAFEGDVLLNGLRVNQLKLSRSLAGSLQVSDKEVHMHAKGSRPDESLDMDLALPLFQPHPAPEPQHLKNQGGLFPGRLGAATDILPVPRINTPTLLPGMRRPQQTTPPKSTTSPGIGEGGTFSLRCGKLSISAQVNASSSVVDAAVMGLQLDELELASLRGEVQEVSLNLNFDTRMGRGKVNVAGPRFSGLQGEALSGGVRWERDVIRLEKAVLQQRTSRYEVQGEYVIPPDTRIPDSAASMAPMDLMGGRSGTSLKAMAPKSAFDQATGRWRLQVTVPQANMQEILPAARLLSRATAVTPSDYERAKTLFLAGLHNAGIQAQSLVVQLEEAAKQARLQACKLQEAVAANSPTAAAATATAEGTAETSPGKGSSRGSVPGLQDLKGSWSGAFQAYGGGGGAANTDFDVKGTDWQWGNYSMEQVVARGSCHSNEGLKLEEVALRAQDAKLLLRGGLLGPHQNATLMLTDFPVALLQPLFRAVPALEHAAPAVGTLPEGVGLGGGSAGGAPFHGLNMAFARSGRAHALIPAETLYSSSPVNGLLFVRGTIGGSVSVPEGEVLVRLFEGAVGPTRLATASATARLDSQQRLAFKCHLEPAQARHTGHVQLSGSLPLLLATPSPHTEDPVMEFVELDEAMGEGSDEDALVPAPAPPLGLQDVEAELYVKDAGMMLVSTVAPDFTWQSGNADIAIRVSGQQSQPVVEGSAQLRKASIYCPHLKYPMTNVHADIKMANNRLQVEGLEARVGRRGHIKVRGGLPVTPSSPPLPSATVLETTGQDKEGEDESISIGIQALELRVRNVYTGHLEADLQLRRSLMQPEVGGAMRFSRGVAYLNPQGAGAPPAGQGTAEAGAQEADLVAQAFSALQARKEGTSAGLVRQQSRLEAMQQAEVALVQPAVAERVALQGLTIQLGPDLRTTYPVVMNFNISGQVHVTGPADPQRLQLQGTIKLDSGEVNLVATQLVLDREHPNRMVFEDGQGLDPNIDLKFRGPNLRALIQGKASTWQSHLTLTPTGGSGGEGTEQLDPSQAAKMFEGQLASALVAEDGQLALSNLAQSAAHAVMPKLQTQGQLGQARWRLVSAPSIPGLLSLDPIGDPTSLLSSLTMGTEVEVQFGKSLQATMARKLRDSDIATQWTLNYQLNNKLRMQFNISSSSPYPRTLVFQYSGEGGPRS